MTTQEKIDSEQLTILDFYATWCGPCVAMTPTINELIKEETDVYIEKIDVDKNATLTQKYGIRSMPTLVYIKNGEVLAKETGKKTKNQILDNIKLYK